MIKKITFLLMMLPVLGFGQLASWNFFGATEVATWSATTIDVNLVQTATLTRGSGATESAGGNSFRTVGFMNDGIDVINDDYFQFELTALTGFEMSLSSIDGQVRGTSSFTVAPGVENQFAYSLDGTTFTLIGSPLIVTTNNSALPTTDLSGITALQNIPVGTTVTFRFYASGQTTTGGWGFTSASATTEDLVVGGVTAPVVVNPCTNPPAVFAGADQTICAGTSVSLIATGAGVFTWDNGISQGAPFTPTATTTYTVTVDDGVCTNTDQVTITVNEASVAGTITVSSLNACLNDVLTGTISGNTGTVEWFAQAPVFPTFIPVATGSTVSLPAAQAGTYTVKAEVTNGVCPAETTNVLTIVVNELPVVTISENANVLTASLTGVDYEWMNCADSSVVATTQVFTPTANGSYFVEVTDANGCTGSSTCTAVTTLGLEYKTAMNSFNISPNPTKGKVTITAAGNESASVVIFNALGKQISKASNIQNGSVIDFSAFNNGVYMVQITTNKGTKVQRVVKN